MSVQPKPLRFQRFARVVLRLVVRVLMKCRLTGLHHVPRSGRLIVMMNHIHGLDPILVTISLPRDINIMSKIENLQTPVLGPLTKWFGGFPIRRHKLDLEAIRKSIEVLEREEALLMAPEGTRTRTGGLQRAYDGMALLATRTNSPILPVAISGNETLLHNLKRLRRTPLQVTVGEPFIFALNDQRRYREQLSQMTDEAMYRLAALLPAAYRGVYADLSKATMVYSRLYRPVTKGRG